ncbi:MAG: hypothetical protein FJ382_10740 [Verrucomicrobia bacterium]|nr:hypothetical protein [Verrucomicrobiota bacterium]
MKRTSAALLLGLLPWLLLAPACTSERKPKPAIAAETESEFRLRWIARRMGELQAGPEAVEPRRAREIAAREFAEKFGLGPTAPRR